MKNIEKKPAWAIKKGDKISFLGSEETVKACDFEFIYFESGSKTFHVGILEVITDTDNKEKK